MLVIYSGSSFSFFSNNTGFSYEDKCEMEIYINQCNPSEKSLNDNQ
jgi:hypothetical protein